MSSVRRPVPASAPRPRRSSKYVKYYLVVYNVLMCVAWSYFLWTFLGHLAIGKFNPRYVLRNFTWDLIQLQSLAVLELVHSASGREFKVRNI